jgi:serine phosphatase RsbU (regulator of sigma subunit)
MAHPDILIAAAARPHPTEDVSGDIWHVDWRANSCRIAVIDGLGHGPDALAAATRARGVLAEAPQTGAVEILRRCHDALKGTRGAAVGIATVEPAAGRVTYVGVGNVEARLVTPDRSTSLPSARGIVGLVLPTIRPVVAPLGTGWLLLIHSDGVSGRIELTDLPTPDESDPQHLADAILARWGRTTDDATIVVACPAPSGGSRSGS